jgi:hypothetical protein
MHVAFDAVMLSVYLHPTAKPPKPVTDLPTRIQLLVDELEAAGAKIIIPTPVLSEFLVLTGPKDGSLYLSDLSNSDVFDIRPLDTMAAIEASEMHRKAAAAGDKKSGSNQRWQVVKVDRQFVAIAKVNGVSVIYSDDDGVKKLAEAAGITCKGVEDLPAPPVQEAQAQQFGEEDATTSPSASNETAPPSAQSPGGAKTSAPEPEPAPPSSRPAAPGPQPQGSSPATPPPPRSKQ